MLALGSMLVGVVLLVFGRRLYWLFVAGVGFLRRSTFTVLVLTALCGLAFRFWSELGTHVWNLRLLSFWYLGIHLLMGIGVAELIRGVGWIVGRGWRYTAESAWFANDPRAPAGW